MKTIKDYLLNSQVHNIKCLLYANLNQNRVFLH